MNKITKRFLYQLWHWSWLITLPIILFLGTWLWLTVDRYYTYSVRFYNNQITLLDIGHEQWHFMLRQILNLGFIRNSSNLDHLKQVDLYIEKSQLKKLNSHMPASGYKYVNAALQYNDKRHNVKYRYRGDHHHHWSSFKKSIRIKTKKQFLYEGMRTFNLIRPKTTGLLNNYLSYRLATKMGLMSPKTAMVNVNINDSRQGIHVLVEQLEEMILRNHQRMPGDIYRGENVGKSLYFGVSDTIFENVNLWDKIAVNNHYPKSHNKPLEKLLTLLNGKDSDSKYQQLNALVDIDAFAKFAAYTTLSSTSHFDNIHNWRLYYDLSREKFEPIVWDPVGWHYTMLPNNAEQVHDHIISSQLIYTLYKNNDFVRKRNHYLRHFFKTNMDKAFLAESLHDVEAMEKAIVDDPNIIGLDSGKYVEDINQLYKNITKVFSVLRQTYSQTPKLAYTINGQQNYGVELSGNQAIDQLIFQYEKPISTKNLKILMHYQQNQQWFSHDITSAATIKHKEIQLNMPLLGNFQLIKSKNSHWYHFKSMPAYYEFEIMGASSSTTDKASNFVDNNTLIHISGLSHKQFIQAKLQADMKKTGFDNIYNNIHIKQPSNPIVWAGKIHLDKVEEIHRDLIIRAGTEIILNQGAGLIIYGRLDVQGHKNKPVQFRSYDKQHPWGAIVLKGLKANGSTLKHCLFDGGSGLKSDLFEYSAMFSVHDVQQLTIDHCTFKNSKVVDDMVHAVYSEIHFKHCEFHTAKSDAVDLDISRGIIENSRFINSGNDGLDLMSSAAVVKNSYFLNSGDKGISVGESTKLLAQNNQFINNHIGVQAKDGSHALIMDSEFSENLTALYAYKKNWRYNAGGKLTITGSKFSNNDRFQKLDQHSRMVIYNMTQDQLVIDKNIEVHMDNMPDSRLREFQTQVFHSNLYLPYWQGI